MESRSNKILLITIFTFTLLIFGDMISNFKIFDVMYILSLIIYLIHYKFVKDAE